MYSLTQFLVMAQTGAENAEGGGEHAAHELPNFITVINSWIGDSPVGQFLHHWENMIFSLGIALFIIIIARLASRNPQITGES